MDRPHLSRKTLVEILLLDHPWHPTDMDAQEGEAEEDFQEALWQHLHADLVEIQADRLEQAFWAGFLLDRQTVRERMVEVGMPIGAFQIRGMPVAVTPPLALAIADVQLTMGPVDLCDTHAQRWDRLSGILTASEMFGVSPTTFMMDVSGASDWILRLSTTPELFRAHQRARIDEKHPDVVRRYVQALRTTLSTAIGTHHGSTMFNLFIDFPMGEAFWEMRAWWLQEVEAQIDRVWPGQAQGSLATVTVQA